MGGSNSVGGGSGGGSHGGGGGAGFGGSATDPCFTKRAAILEDVLTLLPTPRPKMLLNDPIQLNDNAGVFEAHWNGIHIGNVPLAVANILRLCFARGVSYDVTVSQYDPNMPRVEIALIRL